MTNASKADFLSKSFKAALDFLQTVVVLDDRAAFGGEAPPEEEIVEPDPDASVGELTLEQTPAAKASLHDLDANAVVKSFAEFGIACAILRPDPENDLKQQTLKLAARSDILILDWDLNNDQGRGATDLIKNVINEDSTRGGRLRLICIYTGQSPMVPLRDRVATEVTTLSPVQAKKLKGKFSEVSLANAYCKIIFLNKTGAGEGEEATLAYSPEELPEILVSAFAEFAGGLLPNATLASIAELRNHTHRMLARFNRRMDGPLLTHRTLSAPVEDAEQYVADLLMQELEAHVPLRRLAQEYTGRDSVRAYFEHLSSDGKSAKLMLGGNPTPFGELTPDQAAELVEEGIRVLGKHAQASGDAAGGDKERLERDLKDNLHKRLYMLCGESFVHGQSCHEDFAVVSSIRRHAADVLLLDEAELPQLKLGSIVKLKQRYYVCFTPLCDSVRIPQERGAIFIFGELKKSSGEFNLVIPEGNAKTKLKADRKHLRVLSVKFKPEPGKGVIRAAPDGNALVLKGFDVDDGAEIKMTWLAEMKPMQAQRIVFNFANHIARIGLDEFEWQRRNAPLSSP